jgi:hypothetical protein
MILQSRIHEAAIRKFEENARGTFTMLHPLLREAKVGTQSPLGAFVTLADTQGKPLDAVKVGALLPGREKAELSDCQEKVTLLVAQADFLCSWQCGTTAEKSPEGAVRLTNGEFISSAGLPAGGWNEALAAIVAHRISRELMPIPRLREIITLNRNQWIRALAREFRIRF